MRREEEQSVSPARAALRDATRAAHLRLHGHPALAALAAGTIAPTQYLQLLARLYGFHLPFERALIEAAPRHGVDLRIGARAHLLARDLVDLGAKREAIAGLPMATAPALRSPGEWLGALYVREGSTLGAARLAAALDPLLGAGNPRGRRFLSGGDAESWRECCAALEEGARRGLLPEIVEGARASFQAIELWLADRDGAPISVRAAPGRWTQCA
ncbi:hypothetical+protein [Methylocapsa aurea]|uniref:biliverdin-producing heme oxygenase n=1 Tax=Methylocapsa aurea TaxID=663610 RepID=UPI003D18913C